MTDSVWVKVCGLTRPEDVEAAVASGADAVGLVLVGRSPRCLDERRATELAAIAKARTAVVVLVEGEPRQALAAARLIGADTVQPYGLHAVAIAEAALESGMNALLPVPVSSGEPINLDGLPAGARPLLDTAVGGASGGAGVSFDWRRAHGITGAVVAGGLSPENVAVAIAQAEPWGVDASSGLETELGVKDHGKVSAFVQAAKTPEELL